MRTNILIFIILLSLGSCFHRSNKAKGKAVQGYTAEQDIMNEYEVHTARFTDSLIQMEIERDGQITD